MRAQWKLRKPSIAGVAAVGTIGAMLVAIPIASSVSTATADTGATPVTSRPDLLAASQAARAQHSRVEVTSLDTQMSTTYANADGSLTTDQSSTPFQAQVAPGQWEPLNNTLTTAANGSITPTVSLTDVEFAKSGSKNAASFGGDQKSAGFRWPTSLPAPSLEGDTASYANVLPNTDLTANATATGFETSLVVHSRPTGSYPSSITLPLTGTGITWSVSDAGVLAGVDSSGRTVVTSTSAAAWDSTVNSKTDEPLHNAPLALVVTGPAGAQSLVVAMPTALLDDPSTVYPVIIDPSTSWTKTAWTYVDSGSPGTSHYNATGDAPVGDYGAGVDRSLFAFATSGLHGTHILSATLTLNETWSASCTASQFDIYDVPAGFTSSTTWTAQPSVGTKYASVTAAKGFSSSCPAGNVTADLTSWATAAAANGNATNYIELMANNEADANSWKKFNQSASISVTYNSYPSYPYGMALNPCGGSCSSPHMTNSATPTVTAFIWDSDNDPIRFDFEVWAGSSPSPTTLVTSGSVNGVMSGNAANWTVPSGMLSNGSTYETRVRGFDGTDYGSWSSDVTGWGVFTVDTVSPANPSISSTTWTAGAWASATSGTIAWSDTSTDVSTYSWQLDGGTWSAPSSSTSQALSGLSSGIYHVFNVRATDTAGNVSAIATFGFGVGTGGMTSPSDQDRTQANVTLSGAGPTGYPYIYYQWRQGTTAAWSNIPSGDVTIPGTTTHPSPWPVTSIASSFVWNLASTVRTAAGIDGAVQLQACLSASSSGSSPVCQSSPVTVQLAAHAFGASYATSAVGPGMVSLLTGDYAVDNTDVAFSSYLGSLSVGRSFTTLAPAPASTSPTGVYGPGWTASLEGPDAGAGAFTPTVGADKSYVVLTGADGSESTYTATSSLSANPITYSGIGGASDGSSLALANPGSSLTLTDAAGTVTTWTSSGGVWVPASVTQSGASANTTASWVYGTSGISLGLPVRIIGASPPGLTCSPTTAGTTTGCRSLTFDYLTLTVGGSSVTRLQDINFVAYDPSTAAMHSVQVAAYDYDANGRLSHAWDPRISPNLKTAYTYDASGRLSTITLPGQSAWTLAYNASGQLVTVSRPDPAGGTATNTVIYGVPFTGTGAPVDLSGTITAQWGQTADVPVSGAATAVFPATHVPAGQTFATVASTDWPYSDLTYLDVDGRAVNTASYGAGAWQITANSFNPQDGANWSLTAGDLSQALSPTANTDPTVAALSSSTARAALLTTNNVYSSNDLPTDSYGPMHPVKLANGTLVDGRTHIHSTYDEGAPGGGPYNLVTTSVTSAQTQDAVDHDSVTRHNGYAAVVTGDPTGWSLGRPTTTTNQLGSSPSSSDPVTTTRYDSDGRTIETRLPAGASGGDARSRVTTYYTATGTGSCVSAAFAGLPCSTGPAAQPPSGNALAVTTYSYDMFGDVTTKTETAGTTVRTTTLTYDAAGRLIGRSISVTPSGAGGTTLPAVTYGYDSATGLSTTTSTTVGGTTTTLTTAYDAIGRVTAYTDASANAASYTYDLAGRPLTINDGKGTETFTYDTSTEHRGAATGVTLGVGSAPGTLTATYDADGNLATQTYPSGLVRQSAYNNAGQEVSRSYAKSSTTWFTDTMVPNAQGATGSQTGPIGSQTFTYDGAGRLTQTADDSYDYTVGATRCVTRVYGFDTDSNRTSLTSYPDDGSNPASGHCTTSTTPATTTDTFDQADRLTNTGYSYDTLGRTTVVPAADAQSVGSIYWLTGAMTLGYYVNDMVASEAQGGVGSTYALDPAQDRVLSNTAGGTTLTSRFANGAEQPAWIGSGSGSWTRYIKDLGGSLGFTQDQAGTVTILLTNLHGDVVAYAADSTSATGVTSYSEFTEYGSPRLAYAVGTYGWLGADQISTSGLGGQLFMGLRMYNPVTGRFLSNDSIYGGNANAYVYPQDPVGQSDTSGAICYSASATNKLYPSFYQRLSLTWCANDWFLVSTTYNWYWKTYGCWPPGPGCWTHQYGQITANQWWDRWSTGGYFKWKFSVGDAWYSGNNIETECTASEVTGAGYWEFHMTLTSSYIYGAGFTRCNF